MYGCWSCLTTNAGPVTTWAGVPAITATCVAVHGWGTAQTIAPSGQNANVGVPVQISNAARLFENKRGIHDGDPTHDHDYTYGLGTNLWFCACGRKVADEAASAGESSDNE
jgi:hypothetical protein